MSRAIKEMYSLFLKNAEMIQLGRFDVVALIGWSAIECNYYGDCRSIRVSYRFDLV